MTVEQLRAALKKRWQEEKDQREYAEDLLCMYDGDWVHLIEAEMRRRFLPDTVKALKVEIDPSLNLVQRVVDKVAATYTEPAERLVGEAEPSQYTRDGLLDDVFDVADKMIFLTRNVLIRPYAMEEGIDHDIITPDRFTALPTRGRRGQVDAVMYYVPEQKRYVVWGKDLHFVMTRNFEVDQGFGVQPNDYGEIPVLPCFESEPVRDFWQIYLSEGLRSLALITAQALCDLAYNIKMTSYKKIVINLKRGGKVTTPSDQLMDVAYPVQIEGEGDVGVVDFSGAFDQLLDVIFKRASAPLARWGLRPEMIRQGGLDAQSGYHLKLQMSELTKEHQKRAKRWVTRERRLYKLSRTIMDVERRRATQRAWGLLPLPKGDLTIAHADLGPPQDPKETAEYWILLKDNGLCEEVDALKAIHGLTQEEAEEKLERIHEEKAAKAPNLQPANPDEDDEQAADETGDNPFGAVPMGGDA